MLEARGKFFFGNYITMVTNLLYFAEQTGETVFFNLILFGGLYSLDRLSNCVIRKTTGGWLSLDVIERLDVRRIREIRNQVTRSDIDFYYGRKLPHDVPPPSDTDRRRLIHLYVSRYLPPLLTILPDTHLVIHIRSGDIFDHGHFHAKYIQPPLAYYCHILDTHPEYTNVIIVTQADKKNPVIYELLRKYSHRISIQSCSTEEDLQFLLSARHLVVGTGSFGMYIALCSNALRRLFCFERHNLWYPDAPYEIVVKGVVNEEYPHEWTLRVLQEGTMTREDLVVETLDPSSFQPISKWFWDQ